MSAEDHIAAAVVAALRAVQSDAELVNVRKRLAPGEEALGTRMRDLFDVARAHAEIPLPEVDRLLDHPAYEPRMAAMCILDFKARRRLDDAQRRELYDLYLDRHDRITTWDMVDRAAPRVIGGYLAGRPSDPLYELAGAPEPVKRRTATTATLYFVRAGGREDLAEGFAHRAPRRRRQTCEQRNPVLVGVVSGVSVANLRGVPGLHHARGRARRAAVHAVPPRVASRARLDGTAGFGLSVL